MGWTDTILDRLAAGPWGYHDQSPSASEPVALAAMALAAAGRTSAAAPLVWLDQCQGADGSVGVNQSQSEPGWPTSLAVIAWLAVQKNQESKANHQSAIDRALAWMLKVKGVTMERNEQLGHDSTLVGWPWVESTHSWIEPTAMSVLALKVAGRGEHDRTQEAVRLLIDRLLPDGGCNYGNTTVLGQQLRPHVQPTGLTLAALAGEVDPASNLPQTILYLQSTLSAETTTSSLCWGLIGLSAQGYRPLGADDWLEQKARRMPKPSPYKLALIALAALDQSCPLLPARQKAGVP